jgi:hypothetical protein
MHVRAAFVDHRHRRFHSCREDGRGAGVGRDVRRDPRGRRLDHRLGHRLSDLLRCRDRRRLRGRRHDNGRLDRRRLRSGWRRRRARRQERQGIDVSLLVSRPPHAEVDVRLGEVDGAARTDGADDRSLTDVRPTRDGDRTEVDERRRVAGWRLDRDGLPAGRNRAGKGHDAVGRCKDVRARGRGEVDAAVLAGGVRMGVVERERT